MQFQHAHIAGRTAIITPVVEAAFPRHGAFLSTRQDGRPFYSAMMRDMPDAVQYLRQRGYIIPPGF